MRDSGTWTSSVRDFVNVTDISPDLRRTWQQLENSSSIEHPFVSWDWLECWFQAYVKRGKRIYLVEVFNEGSLCALVPFIEIDKKICGFRFRCLSYPANGHSPRCDVLIDINNEATRVVAGALRTFLNDFDLVMLPAALIGGAIHDILRGLTRRGFALHAEHHFEIARFHMPEGWDAFLKNKSGKFRRRVQESLARARKRGALSIEFFEDQCISSDIVERLRKIDEKTWQHANGSGLFSTPDNATFYSKLLGSVHPTFRVILALLSINNADVAYELAVTRGRTAYFLKYGFDPGWSECRPGVLVQSYLSEFVAEKGCTVVDLGQEVSEEKRRWETERLKGANYWLTNCHTAKGLLLTAALACHRLLNEN